MELAREKIPTIACGEGFALILVEEKDSITVRCWGSNSLGQLGFQKPLGEDGGIITLPQVEVLKDVAVATGSKHTLIITDGELYR